MTLPERLLLYARQFEDQHAPENITLALREAAGAISRLMATHDDMADEIERLRAALEEYVCDCPKYTCQYSPCGEMARSALVEAPQGRMAQPAENNPPNRRMGVKEALSSLEEGGNFEAPEASAAEDTPVKPRIQRDVWVNVYPAGQTFYGDRAYADANAVKDERIACVRLTIDVEEGEGL